MVTSTVEGKIMSDYDLSKNEDRPTYQNVVKAVRKSIKRPLTDEEANEAAKNMIEFFRIALAIYRRMNQDSDNDKKI